MILRSSASSTGQMTITMYRGCFHFGSYSTQQSPRMHIDMITRNAPSSTFCPKLIFIGEIEIDYPKLCTWLPNSRNLIRRHGDGNSSRFLLCRHRVLSAYKHPLACSFQVMTGVALFTLLVPVFWLAEKQPGGIQAWILLVSLSCAYYPEWY